jgi:hypothetical protein
VRLLVKFCFVPALREDNNADPVGEETSEDRNFVVRDNRIEDEPKEAVNAREAVVDDVFTDKWLKQVVMQCKSTLRDDLVQVETRQHRAPMAAVSGRRARRQRARIARPARRNRTTMSTPSRRSGTRLAMATPLWPPTRRYDQLKDANAGRVRR